MGLYRAYPLDKFPLYHHIHNLHMVNVSPYVKDTTSRSILSRGIFITSAFSNHVLMSLFAPKGKKPAWCEGVFLLFPKIYPLWLCPYYNAIPKTALCLGESNFHFFCAVGSAPFLPHQRAGRKLSERATCLFHNNSINALTSRNFKLPL